ncbi:E3 ubiquitin-protein ligase uhrf1 [Blastocladiella emersonii ATCC 22665]|nr:E3 ubiquitin-protein ligase uhrf1 [Blastocladiella emersonii ATCC 22665]
MSAQFFVRDMQDDTKAKTAVKLVAKSERIGAMLDRIGAQLDLPAGSFRLFFSGMLIVDRDMTVHDYRITNNSVLLLHKSLNGGVANMADLADALAASGSSSAGDADADGVVDEDDPNAPWKCEKSVPPVFDNHLTDPDEMCKDCKKDANRRKCTRCGCIECMRVDGDAERTIVCDECVGWLHWECLGIRELPPGDHWYCTSCKNEGKVVKSHKKTKGKAATATKAWGHGNACASVPVKCLVPKKHRGKIPGVLCGQSWKIRNLCAASGVHRPLVAGIHGGNGKGDDGALSIVLSGGYEDDVDHGEEFIYTGSGGRDLNEGGKNLRTANQSAPQKLEKGNLALARTCNAKLNSTKGAEAANWRKSLPVRVVRSYKLKKTDHGDYAPDAGVRYDGLYKVVKYYPEKGKAGHMVWRYLMRRDDDEPAPWTPEGKQYIADHGLTMIESMTEDDAAAQAAAAAGEGGDDDDGDDELDEDAASEAGSSSAGAARPPAKKKQKANAWTPPAAVLALIKKDKRRATQWNALLAQPMSRADFIRQVSEFLSCLVCHTLLEGPVVLPCNHTVCTDCYDHMRRVGIDACPGCRTLHHGDAEDDECLVDIMVKLGLIAPPPEDKPKAKPKARARPSTVPCSAAAAGPAKPKAKGKTKAPVAGTRSSSRIKAVAPPEPSSSESDSEDDSDF